MGKVTIQRIAKELGFSRNTVSMALKGNDMVAPQTREMIIRYAKELGFYGLAAEEEKPVPEKAAEASYHIMILKRAHVAVYWDKVISGISEEASRHNCHIQIVVVTDEDERQQRLPLGLNGDIQAVFSVNLFDKAYMRKIRQMGIQIYLLDNYRDMEEEPFGDVVKMEGFSATAQLTRHLIDQGMRRIGFLNENSSIYESMYDRYAGYQYAMKQAGIEPDPAIVLPDVRNNHFYEIETYYEIVKIYEAGIFPEAVVCGNDEIAKQLTQVLRIKGYRVPEDVALTGFDNDEEGMLDPFFSTVNVNAKWLGQRMVQSFIRRVEHPGIPYEEVLVYGKVILRRSSYRM